MENCQVAQAQLQSLRESVGRAELLTRFGLNYGKLGIVKTYTIPMGQKV